MQQEVFVLGGYQTDFARNWTKEGNDLFGMLRETMEKGVESIRIEFSEIQSVHVGNFTAELFCQQGHLGSMLLSVHPDLYGVPAARHEGACASGSLAILAGMNDILAGHYDLVAVNGIELMRNVNAETAAAYLGVAAWQGKEATEARFPWVYLFSQIAEQYRERYGLKDEHLREIARINLDNAKVNENAISRNIHYTDEDFTLSEDRNPIIEGCLRKQDCSRVTDGAAVVFLASEKFARNYAAKQQISLSQIPRIKGWGHRSAPITLEEKLARCPKEGLLFPHVQQSILDAYKRAGISDFSQLDGIETHDCFSISEYMAIDHFGITAPGESWKAIEAGWMLRKGKIPINAGGGLIGCGHPVGATGIRMMLDAFKQSTGQAGAYQIEDAKTIATLNIGGSLGTVVSFVVGV